METGVYFLPSEGYAGVVCYEDVFSGRLPGGIAPAICGSLGYLANIILKRLGYSQGTKIVRVACSNPDIFL